MDRNQKLQNIHSSISSVDKIQDITLEKLRLLSHSADDQDIIDHISNHNTDASSDIDTINEFHTILKEKKDSYIGDLNKNYMQFDNNLATENSTFVNEKIKALQSERVKSKGLKSNIEELKTTITKSETDIKSKDAEISQLKQDSASKEVDKKGLNEQISSLKDSESKLKTSINEKDKLIQESAVQLKVYEELQDKIKDAKLEDSVKSIIVDKNDFESVKKANEAKISELQKNIKQKEVELKNKSDSLSDTLKKVKELSTAPSTSDTIDTAVVSGYSGKKVILFTLGSLLFGTLFGSGGMYYYMLQADATRSSSLQKHHKSIK